MTDQAEVIPDEAGFWTVERAVAFVLGPLLVVGTGLLAAYLTTKLGVKVDAATIATTFSTPAIAVAAFVWKWLHGRQSAADAKLTAAVKLISEMILATGDAGPTPEKMKEYTRAAKLTVTAIANGKPPPAATQPEEGMRTVASL